MDELNLQLMSPEVGQLDLVRLRLTQLWLRLLCCCCFFQKNLFSATAVFCKGGKNDLKIFLT